MARKTHEEFVRELKKVLAAPQPEKRTYEIDHTMQEELERKFAELFGDPDDDG